MKRSTKSSRLLMLASCCIRERGEQAIAAALDAQDLRQEAEAFLLRYTISSELCSPDVLAKFAFRNALRKGKRASGTEAQRRGIQPENVHGCMSTSLRSLLLRDAASVARQQFAVRSIEWVLLSAVVDTTLYWSWALRQYGYCAEPTKERLIEFVATRREVYNRAVKNIRRVMQGRR